LYFKKEMLLTCGSKNVLKPTNQTERQQPISSAVETTGAVVQFEIRCKFAEHFIIVMRFRCARTPSSELRYFHHNFSTVFGLF
jgi:hypothetical protein